MVQTLVRVRLQNITLPNGVTLWRISFSPEEGMGEMMEIPSQTLVYSDGWRAVFGPDGKLSLSKPYSSIEELMADKLPKPYLHYTV